jgi:hypothetical protein
MRSKHMLALTVPHRSTSNPAPIAQHQRLALLRQAVNREDVALQDRIAAVLVLLYAQPLTRITRLTTDDVVQEDGEVLVRLGDPPSPVPEPFASLLLAYLDQRPNTMTATNPDARWLFPGRRAGQPMTSDTLELRGGPGLCRHYGVEWEEFLGHFERRRVASGDCGRAYGTGCVHEHSCLRYSLLRPDPAQRDRIVQIRDNLLDRIAEAEREGWRGEVEDLKVSLAAAEQKLTQVDERSTVDLGLPTFREAAGRTVTAGEQPRA